MLHVLIAWVILIASFVAAGLVVLKVLNALISVALSSFALLLVAIFSLSIIVAVVGIGLFSVAWFAYLRLFLDAGSAIEVEARLSKHMNIALMNPIYKYVKAKALKANA